jgi:hypothetical protein
VQNFDDLIDNKVFYIVSHNIINTFVTPYRVDRKNKNKFFITRLDGSYTWWVYNRTELINLHRGGYTFLTEKAYLVWTLKNG